MEKADSSVLLIFSVRSFKFQWNDGFTNTVFYLLGFRRDDKRRLMIGVCCLMKFHFNSRLTSGEQVVRCRWMEGFNWISVVNGRNLPSTSSKFCHPAWHHRPTPNSLEPLQGSSNSKINPETKRTHTSIISLTTFSKRIVQGFANHSVESANFSYKTRFLCRDCVCEHRTAPTYKMK